MKQFDVRGIPALLFFRNGESVDGVVGAVPRTALVQRLEQHLWYAAALRSHRGQGYTNFS